MSIRNERIAKLQKLIHQLDRKDRWDMQDKKDRDSMRFEYNGLLIEERLDTLGEMKND